MVYIVDVIVVVSLRQVTSTPLATALEVITSTSTSTINPVSASSTVTFFTTETTTTTTTTTEIDSTATLIPSLAYEEYVDNQYAACVDDTNQLGPRNSKGNYLSVALLTGNSQIFLINDVKTARDCCTACWDTAYCQFSQFVSTTDSCYIYGGAGDVCLNPGYMAARFQDTVEPNEYMSVISNGPCGTIGSLEG